mmetsp:Transcript_11660/g.11693  ORF Transcript_11660/g.11693 Transcript_11660/m.11693 type:complete len:833 (+) Transcript_11660:34-2532(+)|eukprot:CAMPEP_0182432218 /NCGR_PEP_ID=MMETSP1167-20130531/54842_1 /TAXON_ID=2988 /ORGANISM="Mallomonas Sp, Strain CCMP3275" /LENGTH=832 /DNA_ID=CAMNT_0024619451 /DNA_START=50 /DNA_END=2548 /DNA_ORIENTATION=+
MKVCATNLDVEVGKILEDEIYSGFLMQYCESQFNTENLEFLRSVKRFKEHFASDLSSWPKSWMEIDEDALKDDSIIHMEWPSNIVNREAVVGEIKKIWDDHIDDDADVAIFLPSAVLQRTKHRMGLVDLYGPEVFSEACIDPTKTIYSDIIPRFMFSPLYTEMHEQKRAGKKRFTRRDTVKSADDNQVKVVSAEKNKQSIRNVTCNILTTLFVIYPRECFLACLKYFTRDPNLKKNPKLLRSLLSKQWSYAVPFTCALNIFLYGVLGAEHYLSSDPVCNYDYHLPYWSWLVDYTIVGGFAMSIFLNLNRMANSTGQLSDELYAALAGNIGISVQAGLAMFLSVIMQFGGTCKDKFGVVTPAVQWPEWLTTVPFLIYTAVAVEDKARLSLEDWGVIIAMFFCILTGFILNIRSIPVGLGVFFLIISCCCLLSTVYMVVRASKKHSNVVDTEASALTRAAVIAEAEQARTLAILCLVAMPLLTLLYFMAMGGALSEDVFYCTNNIMSCVVKLIFAAVAAESHMSTTEQMFTALEADVEVAKEGEAFAEHLFQKVSIPLKSVMAGLELLQETLGRDTSPESETLRHLTDTTQYISTNLNDLLSADKSKIKKENAISLHMAPFVLSDLLKKVLVSFQSKMKSKLIMAKMDIKPEVPRMMVGDMLRLEHSLSVLFDSGLRESKPKGKMTLGITIRPFVQRSNTADRGKTNDAIYKFHSGDQLDSIEKQSEVEEKTGKEEEVQKELYLLCFEVTRNMPISAIEHSNFINARKKNNAEEEKHAPGTADPSRDLSLAREIVVMHGGSVFSSTAGKATTVGFSVPFNMSKGTVVGINDSIV